MWSGVRTRSQQHQPGSGPPATGELGREVHGVDVPDRVAETGFVPERPGAGGGVRRSSGTGPLGHRTSSVLRVRLLPCPAESLGSMLLPAVHPDRLLQTVASACPLVARPPLARNAVTGTSLGRPCLVPFPPDVLAPS